MVCEKRFRSAGQLANHERSKKHLEAVAELRQLLEEEELDVLLVGEQGRRGVWCPSALQCLFLHVCLVSRARAHALQWVQEHLRWFVARPAAWCQQLGLAAVNGAAWSWRCAEHRCMATR